MNLEDIINYGKKGLVAGLIAVSSYLPLANAEKIWNYSEHSGNSSTYASVVDTNHDNDISAGDKMSIKYKEGSFERSITGYLDEAFNLMDAKVTVKNKGFLMMLWYNKDGSVNVWDKIANKTLVVKNDEVYENGKVVNNSYSDQILSMVNANNPVAEGKYFVGIINQNSKKGLSFPYGENFREDLNKKKNWDQKAMDSLNNSKEYLPHKVPSLDDVGNY